MIVPALVKELIGVVSKQYEHKVPNQQIVPVLPCIVIFGGEEQRKNHHDIGKKPAYCLTQVVQLNILNSKTRAKSVVKVNEHLYDTRNEEQENEENPNLEVGYRQIHAYPVNNIK